MAKITSFFIALFNYFMLKYFNKEIIITNTFYGERKFSCKNNIEYYRANNLGGEEAALGAFLFLLEKEDVVWDIGSSIGLFSIYSATYARSIIAFEPDSEIFDRLKKNVRINKFENRIICYKMGISNEKGSVSLNSDGLNGHSPSISNLGRHTKRVDITVNSIDNLIKNDGFTTPTVIKIDIEGAEILALKGAKDLLNSVSAPRLLFIELHPLFLKSYNSSTDEVISLVNSYGYKILSINERDAEMHLIAFKFK
jgi:FkbM family methyltransferase